MNKSRKLAYLLATMAGICLLSAAALAAGYGNAPQPEPVNDKDGSLFPGGSCTNCDSKDKDGSLFPGGPCVSCTKDGSLFPGGPANHALKMAVFSLVHAKNA